jgi:hypothetical protein
MADGIGYLTILGTGVESVSNTPVNVTQRLPNLEFTPDKEYQYLLDESLGGNVFRRKADLGVVDIRGTWRMLADYRLACVICTHFFGSLAAGRYTFASALTATLTMAIDKQVGVWELSGVFINQLVHTWGPGFSELSGTLIAMGVTYSGGQNTATELLNLLPPTARKCKSAPDLTLRLGVDSAALTATENIKTQSGSITLNRTMAETHENGAREIRKPIASGFADGTLEAVLTRYDTNQYKTWLDANTSLQAALLYDEEGGAGTKEWYIPHLTLTAAPNPVSGPEFIPQSIAGDITTGEGVYTAITISAAAADNSINDSGTAFPYMHVGAELWTSGFTGTATNNEKRTVVSRTTGKIVLSGGTALVNDAAGESVTIVYRNPPAYVTEA